MIVWETCGDLAIVSDKNTLHREVSGSEEPGQSTRGHTNVCFYVNVYCPGKTRCSNL